MKNPMWGVTGAAYLRLKEPEYEDGVGTPRYVTFLVDFWLFSENLGHFPRDIVFFELFLPFLIN